MASELRVNTITSTTGVGTVTLGSGGVSFSGTPTFNDVTLSSINGNAISGTRNRIINGDMRIDQRNAGASVTPTATSYTLDRWGYELTLASKLSFQQVSDAPAGFAKSIKITVVSSASMSASDANNVYQMIEGFNVADLAWGTASATSIAISFWVKTSAVGVYSWFIRNTGDTRNYVGTFTANAANTWEYKTITIAGDTSGTWDSGNGRGIMLGFALGDGSTFETIGGAWAAGVKMQTAGSVDFISQANGATFYLTGVQLEPGTVATPFERRSYGQELALCQRYYEVVSALGGTYNGTGGSLTISFATFWKVTKRTAPTATVSTGATQSVDVSNITTYQGSITSGSWYNPGTITASAEL